MKKLSIVLCLVGVLSINCASTGNVENNNQGFNSEIHGELYIEGNGSFSMYIPKGWEIRDMNQKYLMIIGPIVDNFGLNINFGDEQYSGPISEYINALIFQLSQFYAEFEVIMNESFMTNSGLQGRYITLFGRLNEVHARQRVYFIQNTNGTAIMVISCSASFASGDRYDSLFDESVKTFTWTN